MALEIIALKLLTNLADIATKILGDRITEYNKSLASGKKPNEKPAITGRIAVSVGDLKAGIDEHLKHVEHWSSSAKFADLKEAKSISQIYVDLDTYLMPVRTHLSQREREQKRPLLESVAKSNGHVVILGQVGAGKTTSVKRLCASFFLKDFGSPITQKFPLLIRLRELPAKLMWPSLPILSAIQQILPLPISVRTNDSKDVIPREWSDETVCEIYSAALDHLKPIIILDGYDEILSGESRQLLIAEFSQLCRKLKFAKIVLTSRVGEYNREVFNASVFEIAPLSRDQITEFSKKWHSDENKSKHFLEQIDNSPYAGAAMKPLTLAHLCAIYERIGEVPSKPKTVYRKIVNLLIEEWDQQRGIQRQSKYSQFSSDRKFDFLCHLAFNLTAQRKQTVFTGEDLRQAYLAICTNFGLPAEDGESVANELESHTGLFIEASYKGYEFVHKSVQEYLTAEYIVRLPHLSIPAAQFNTLSSELAVATAISSNSSQYFCILMQKALASQNLKSFFVPFSTRLLQEKPDFQESPEAFVFAVQAITALGESEVSLNLAARIFKVTTMNAISFFYSILDLKDKPLHLRQIRSHDFLILPLELDIDRGLFNRIRAGTKLVYG